MTMTIRKAVAFLLIFLLSGFTRAELVGVPTYYHTNLVGSPVAASSSSGAILWTTDYLPYGEKYATDNNASSNKVWFTGHVQDAPVNLVYMEARYYDPDVGRFLAIDPVGFTETNPQSFNRYAYANNNPYSFIDADGKLSIRAISYANRNAGVYIRFNLQDSYREAVRKPAIDLIGGTFKRVKKVVDTVDSVEDAVNFYPDAVGASDKAKILDVIALDKKLAPYLTSIRSDQSNGLQPSAAKFIDALNSAIDQAGCPMGCRGGDNPVRKQFEKLYGGSVESFVNRALDNQRNSRDLSVE